MFKQPQIHFRFILSHWFHKSHWWWRWCVWGADTGAGQRCHPTDWHSVRLLYTFIHNETRQRMVQVFDAHTTDQSGTRWLEDGPMGIQRPEPSCRDWSSGNWYERSISQGWSFIVEKWKMAADVVASSSSVSMIQEMLARCCLRTDASLLLWCISLLPWFTAMDSNKSKHLLLQRSILSKWIWIEPSFKENTLKKKCMNILEV